jgi:hypothetical protein
MKRFLKRKEKCNSSNDSCVQGCALRGGVEKNLLGLSKRFDMKSF